MKVQIIRIATLLCLLLSWPLFCQYEYTRPPELGDGWKTADLNEYAATERFKLLFDKLADADHQLHSMLLIKDQKIILEEYFNGYEPSKQHDLRSVTKSIRSLLTGIALEQKVIKSIDDPVLSYLPNLQPEKNLDPRKQQISLKHLLTMSSGLDCNDWDQKSKGQEDKVYKKKDWLQYTLDLPQVNDPGSVSAYCSMGTILLAEVIGQSAGTSIEDFGRKQLFEPMGITNISFGHTKDKPVISSGKRWYMTPRDMAKIGQLVLNNGKWYDRQLVPKKWVEEATSRHTQIGGVNYGYLWWRIPFKQQEKQVLSLTATGNGGQYIMVLPDIDLVAVFTGGAYNSPEDKLPFAIMRDIVIPSLTKEIP